MRFKQEARPGGKGSRRWKILLTELKRWTLRYRVEFPAGLLGFDEQQSTTHGLSSEDSGTFGTSGTSGTETETSERCPTCGEQDWDKWHDGRRLCMSCLRRGS